MTYVIRNILHDPSVFPDPFEFQPERHLYPLSQELVEKMEVFDRLPFGFGRRLDTLLVHSTD